MGAIRKAAKQIPAVFWHLLLVTLLGLPLITPLLRWTAVACTHDGHLHVHRIAAMRHAWENGIYFTRWLPDLAFGYGYPFFIYREPAPLYAALLPHLLGLPLPAASNLFYGLCILAAGWFMFLWVRDILGPRAGFVGAVAYMAAPYVLLDALVRGNAPESLALPLFPFLLWIGRRWMMRGTAVPFLLTTLGLAFLSLSHNISTLIFVPTLCVYLLVVGWLQRLSWRTGLGRVILIFVLGLGMTLFYTAGALLEMDQVTLQQSTATRNNDFHFNFASLAEILAPVAAEDPNLLNPPLPIRLGWVTVGLAIIGVTTLFWRRDLRRARSDQKQNGAASSLWEQKVHIILMGLATAVYLLMALPASLPLWENLPLIDFVQFPWRFIGRAALPVAFLAAAPFACTSFPRPRRSRLNLSQLIFYAAIALLIIEAIPLLYPRLCDEELFPTIVTVHNYERGTGLVGVDPEGSYFPRTVEKRPQGSLLEADYLAGRTPERFDLSVLPDGATAVFDYGRLSAEGAVDSPVPFTAQYRSFAFPGWVATVDGEIAPITPSDPEGLITFPVPAGTHSVRVRWTSTPLRTVLSLLSLAAFFAALWVTWRLWRQRPRASALPAAIACSLSKNELVGLLLLAVLLFAFKLLIDQVENPLRRAAAPPVTHSQPLQTDVVRFEGSNLSQDTVGGGETFDIDLAWTAAAPTLLELQSNVWLAGPDGLLWSDKETQRPRIYEDAPPTWEWQPGQWVWDSREVRVLAGAPPGRYDIVLTLFDLASLQPLTLTAVDGSVLGPEAVIGQIEVTFPQQPPQITPQFRFETVVPGSGLILSGYNQDRETAVPGEPLLLTLFWERLDGPVPVDLSLALRDSDNKVVQTWLTPPALDAQTWPVGQVLREQIPLRLPANLDSGLYQFVLADGIPLGGLTISAPERVFAAPEMETAVGASFGDQIGLAGYSLDTTQSDLQLDLVWRALAEMATSYRVFVHLVDAEGYILAQSDGEPANWTRPTTGWVAGEYVRDNHQLTLPEALPPGPLSLRVGLYDPESGARLFTDTAEFVTLPLPAE